MYTMDLGNESDHDIISMEMLENICDGSQSHPSAIQREYCYKLRDRIKQGQLEWKEVSKYTQNMGKRLHKLFKTLVKEISQDLQPLGDSGSDVPHFIPELRNFSEVTKLSDDINEPWLKENLKDIRISSTIRLFSLKI